MKFEDSTAALAVNSAHGQYIGQKFAEYYQSALIENNFPKEKLDILLAGPDNEEYQDVWVYLFPITLKDQKGVEYIFDYFQGEGDIWELAKKEYDLIEWEEM